MGGRVGFVARGGLWLVGQAAIFLTLLLALFWSRPVLPWTGPLHSWVGAPILMLGILLFGTGLLALGSSLTPLPYPRDDANLRTGGVYRLARHPIYGGIVIGALGYCLSLPSAADLVLVPLVFLFFDRKAAHEERWLRERYPGYGSYAAKTHKLIPWIY